MSIGDTTENAILNLVFRAVNWSLYADNTATTPQTNIVFTDDLAPVEQLTNSIVIRFILSGSLYQLNVQ